MNKINGTTKHKYLVTGRKRGWDAYDTGSHIDMIQTENWCCDHGPLPKDITAVTFTLHLYNYHKHSFVIYLQLYSMAVN